MLMDPQLRAHYNKYGKDKDLAPEGGFTDPREHFQQMFGGDAFRSKYPIAIIKKIHQLTYYRSYW